MQIEDLAERKQLPLELLNEYTRTGTYQDQPAIDFIYKDTAGTPQRHHLRVEQSGKKIMPWDKSNKPLIPFGLDRLSTYTEDYLIIAEGETDALTLWHHGFQAIGIPGAGSWQEEWQIYTAPYSRIYIATDPDAAGNDGAARITAANPKQRLYRINLPSDVNQLHLDLVALGDDFSATFTDLLNDSERIGILPAISLHHHSEPLPQRWLVPNLLPENTSTILYGEGGMGKSYLSLAIALSLASGDSHWYDIADPIPVLYLDWEDTLEVVLRRAYKLLRGMALPELPPNLYYYSPAIQQGQLLENVIAEAQTFINEHDIGLTIIDSIGASTGIDPLDPRAVVKLMHQIRCLGTTLLIDHQAKQQQGDIYSSKTPFGSVYKTNLVRNMFQLEAISLNDGLGLTLRHRKCNIGPLLDPQTFTLTFHEHAVALTRAAHAAPDPETQAHKTLIDYLIENGPTSSKHLQEHFNKSKNFINKHLTDLRRIGRVVQEPSEIDRRVTVFRAITEEESILTLEWEEVE